MVFFSRISAPFAVARMSSKGHELYTYDFCDAAHPVELLNMLRAFYLGDLFTDVSLKCSSGQVFHCHKVVLSGRSAYFKVMFTLDMRERSTQLISLPGVDADILEALVNYAYTSSVSITQTNVQSLLEAADLLQFSTVKRACEEFLVRLLDVDNCLGMHAFAEHHVCPALEREARRLMFSRFEELIQQEEFLELNVKELISILSAENLNVWKEEVLIEAIVKWIAHDPPSRVHDVQDLLQSVKLEMDEGFFRAAVDIQKDEKSLSSLILHSLKSSSEEFTLSCRKLGSSMYVIGGYYWHPLSEVHMWNPASNTWLQGKSMPDHARESYSVSLLGPNIYVTGGYRSETIEALGDVWIYHADADEWTEGRPMLTARYYHCSVALRGCVYAIGGYRAGAPARQTEFYDPLKKEWFPAADMIQGRNPRVLFLCVFLLKGGSCTYEKIQAYQANSNEWSVVTTSPHPGASETQQGCGEEEVHCYTCNQTNHTNSAFIYSVLTGSIRQRTQDS
uniref:Kelch-like family member 23 n=1 Tax=Denticeps clupeoides TaxID=299321 RepID=A0AAY4AXA1_9TELE